MVRVTPKLLLPIFLLVLNKYIDYANPETLKYVRFAFMVSISLVNMAVHLLKQRVAAKNETGRQVRVPNLDGKSDVKTVLVYDTEAVEGLNVQANIGYLITFAMHYWLKVNPPLLFQCLSQPLAIWDSPVFKVHILGYKDDEPPFERPWPVNNFLEAAAASGKAFEDTQKKREERERKMRNGMQNRKAGKKGEKAK